MNTRELIIEIPYGGLGDHLFHSHLPRIAKETGKYDKVYISSRSLSRHPDNLKLTWEYNPFVDGYTDQAGITCDLQQLVDRVGPKTATNLLDEVMYAFGLDNGTTWNEPEIYYQPKYREGFHYTIYDPNYLSWVGDVDAKDAMYFFKKNRFSFDRIMKIRSDKCLFISSDETKFLETPTLEDFCDLIFSSKELFCLTSGTATIAAGLKKKATVFYGKGQASGFRHSKIHNYHVIPHTRTKSLIRKFKSMLEK
jgi:hypothetical protein